MLKSSSSKDHIPTIQHSDSQSVCTFLGMLLDGIQNYTRSHIHEGSYNQISDSYTGIYGLFKFVGGLSSNCSAHLAQIDLDYSSRVFTVRASSHKKYEFTLWSRCEFKEKNVYDLEKMLWDYCNDFRNIWIFDIKTGKRVESMTALSECTDMKLAISALITNIRNNHPVATFKFELDNKTQSKQKLYFMVTCELNDQPESVWDSLRIEIESIIKVKSWDQIYFEIEVNEHTHTAAKINVLDLMKTAYKWNQNHIPIQVKLQIKSQYNLPTRSKIPLSQIFPTPSQILDDFYNSHTTTPTSSRFSTQLLLLQYTHIHTHTHTHIHAQLGQDIHSRWLDDNEAHYYQLRGVIVDACVDDRYVTMPIVKIRENDWYNPYLNNHADSVCVLDEVKMYVYERCVKFDR